MSIVFIHPIEVNSGVFRCVNDSNPYQNFTTPIFSGSPEGQTASTTPKVGPVPGSGLPTLTGDNVFNIYQALGTTGGPPANEFKDSPKITGGIKFGVTPCAEKIDIHVVGRADIYGAGFDTLSIVIDGSTIASFASIGGGSGPPFGGTTTYNQTVTHNFTTHPPCGHIVEISGESGTIYNNNVGYDVKVTVTLNT